MVGKNNSGRQLMILPSLACQARCNYCFGPNRGPSMSLATFDATLDWIELIANPTEKIHLTFHGGEPLLAGYDWYARGLPLLRERFEKQLKLSIQSNLWMLDDAFCALFKEYDVSIGSSLDGPESINDRQRGTGYFSRTMQGIYTARQHGFSVGVICTFTKPSAAHYLEVCEFFAQQGLSFSVHAAVSTLNRSDNQWALTPLEHADLFEKLFDYYLSNLNRVQISTFDNMARSVASGHGTICTFGNCLGKYLTISADGSIFSCNRFAHHPEWSIGHIRSLSDLDELAQSPVWQNLRQRELDVRDECKDCTHFDYCKGGCPYNAVTSADQRDPHCEAYKRLFTRITEQALSEVFSEENLNSVIEKGTDKNGLLKKGKLIQLMREGPHPKEAAAKAREVVAAVALACSESSQEAVEKLDRAGIVTRPELALQSIVGLQRRLLNQSQGLVNIYIHVTYGCNLACDHCYASSGPGQHEYMSIADTIRLIHDAAAAGFRKAVITGGEPLMHPQRTALLNALAEARTTINPTQIVLRTNLAYEILPKLAQQLLNSANQIMVSLDGDEASHDACRGRGTYQRIVQNLCLLREMAPHANLGITAVLSSAQQFGVEGDAIKALGEALDLQVRFKPELPLGRAQAKQLEMEYYSSLEDDDSFETVVYQTHTSATCGLGMNLYVGPQGECYPCHALMNARNHLGSVLEQGLPELLMSDVFQAYKGVTVDSNRQCRHCALRYLCGGFCRAWATSNDPDSRPMNCHPLYRRAQHILVNALDVLDVDVAAWRAAGLPVSQTQFPHDILEKGCKFLSR